jgi:GAF domain-containing protein
VNLHVNRNASRDPHADVRDALLTDLVHIVEGRGGHTFVASILALEGNELRHAAGPTLPARYRESVNGIIIGPDIGSCGTAAFRGQPVYVSDVSTDPLWARWTGLASMVLETGLRACWSVPIMSSGGKVLGTFAIYHREPRVPTAAERDLIAEATRSAAFLFDRNLIVGAPQTEAGILRR